MKPFLLIIALFVSSLSVSYSQDFNKGKETYKRGDYEEALSQLKPLAEHGDALAQNELGRMYSEGHGVLRKVVLAYMWFTIAASNGNKIVTENIDFISMVMTPEDISKAQQMARECVEKNYKGC